MIATPPRAGLGPVLLIVGTLAWLLAWYGYPPVVRWIKTRRGDFEDCEFEP